jgi:uncharacterized protein YbjT (DUF2867 family)
MNDFLIFGSTGLTGRYFLDEVKNRNLKYHLFVREVLTAEAIENQTLFDSENLPNLPNAKSLVICIGYPLDFLELIYMKLNIKKEFKRVDLDLVIKICKKASQAGISNVLIISAVGANSSSLNYYLKIKGMMEDEVRAIGFNSIFFARPGHLLGPRDESRVDVFVRLIEFFGNFFSPLYISILRKYKNIPAQVVAKDLLNSYESSKSTSEIIIHEQK